VIGGIASRLADWKRRSEESGAERDQLVREAKAGGMNIRRIAILSGLSRTTIYKITGRPAVIFTDTRSYAEYEEFVTPRERRARELWGEIEAAKAAGQPHDELTSERNELIAECREAEVRLERAQRRWEEDRRYEEGRPDEEHPS
jgi:hypothetical protein